MIAINGSIDISPTCPPTLLVSWMKINKGKILCPCPPLFLAQLLACLHDFESRGIWQKRAQHVHSLSLVSLCCLWNNSLRSTCASFKMVINCSGWWIRLRQTAWVTSHARRLDVILPNPNPWPRDDVGGRELRLDKITPRLAHVRSRTQCHSQSYILLTVGLEEPMNDTVKCLALETNHQPDPK